MTSVTQTPRETHRLRVIGAIVCAFACTAIAAPSRAQDDAAQAAAQLRDMYTLRDYGGGVTKGKAWAEQYSTFPEVRAWYVMHLARNSKVEQAIAEAEVMVESDATGPWSLFALAGALNWSEDRGKEALDLSAKALEGNPDDLDFLWLRADVIRKQDGNEAAIAFIDGLPPEVQEQPNMLVRKGVALHYLWDELDEGEKQTKSDDGYAAFEQARSLDPKNVEAYYLPAAYYMSAGNNAEAKALLQPALELTPSPEVHQWYWRMIQTDNALARADKVAAIEADVESLLANHPEAPSTLQAIASVYQEFDLPEKQLAIEQRVLDKYSTSDAAEWVLVGRYRALGREIYEEEQATGVRDSAKVEKRRAMLVAFIERPQHNQEGLLGDAYRELFRIVRDDLDADGDYLYELVDGMVKYEGINVHIAYGEGAIALAEHETHLADAERIAKEGIVEAEKKIKEQNEYGLYKTDEQFQKAIGSYTGMMYDALGWVYFHAGRLDEAAEQLNHAHELYLENQRNLYHLGQYHEFMAQQATSAGDAASADQHLDRAEEFYVKGVMVQGFGENPNNDALEMLYVKRHGSDEGYDALLAHAENFDREHRREKVLADMIEEPDTVVPFTLKTLDSSVVAFDDIKGKIVVVNFWGVWCGPCVIEAPEIQKFHERYADDPAVVFLTLDSGDDVDHVREWIAKRQYTFPVMLDDGYVGKVGVHGFPTTWFIDENGRILFEKLGASEKLVEEFGWRVEALKEMSSVVP